MHNLYIASKNTSLSSNSRDASSGCGVFSGCTGACSGCTGAPSGCIKATLFQTFDFILNAAMKFSSHQVNIPRST